MNEKCAYKQEYEDVKSKNSQSQMTWRGHRSDLTNKYSWAIPNEKSLEYLVRCSKSEKIYEIGAGNGYWSYEVQKRGGNIMPIDIDPPDNCWTDVHLGSYEFLDPKNVKQVLLCWPPANHPMAKNCINHLKPEKVFFVGIKDTTITGDMEFHQMLDEEYNIVNSFDIPKWSKQDNRFRVYKKD